LANLGFLSRNEQAFLLNLLLVLDLLIVGEKKGAFEFAIQLANFLVDAKQNFLLTHYFDRLKAIRLIPV